MRAWLALAVLVSGGCTCSDGVCMGTGAAPQSDFLSTAGSPVTITVLNPVECGSRTPTSVEVSVLDPQISRIAATATSPVIVGGSGFATDVTFTPEVAGRHHVVARFEPNFGQAEVDVLVAADRRDAGSIASNGCPRGDFTPGGLALCLKPGTIEVIGPPADNPITGSLYARSGGTLWVTRGASLQRYVEDGGRLVLTETGQPEPHLAIIPGVDDALLLAGSPSRLLWWVDGGTRETGIIPPSKIVWRGGSNVVTVRSGTGADVGWCVQVITADAGTRCAVIGQGLNIVGASPDGIAVDHVLGTGAAEALLFDATSGPGFRLPPGWRLGPLGNDPPWDTVAVMGFDGGGAPDGGPYVLKRTPGGVIVEDYGPGVLNATSSCVTTGTRLIRR